MKTCKEMAFDICNGDKEALNELEKMMGVKISEMTTEQKMVGIAALAAFEKQWRK